MSCQPCLTYKKSRFFKYWWYLMRSMWNVKFYLGTGHEGPEEECRYSYTFSFTSALDEGEWSTPPSGRISPGKETQFPLYRGLGGTLGRSGRVRKILPLQVIDPRTVRLLADLYTDCAIPAHLFNDELCYEITFGTNSESYSKSFLTGTPCTAEQTPTVTHVQWWRGSGKEPG